MKLFSWNVNGIRAVVGKGFHDIVKQNNPDVILLQEVKATREQAPLDLAGYDVFWNDAEKKGYSGTAILSKHKVKSHSFGMSIKEHDNEGRMITLEFDDFFLVNVYTPNSKHELLRLDYRMQWEKDFRDYIQRLETKKPVIIGGDLNVAHQEIDLENPKQNHFNPGFSDEEREAFSKLLSNGYIDTFRQFNNQPKNYTWWPYKFNCRERNIGWRIDYFVASQKLKDRVLESKILPHVMGSDHCPIVMEMK